MKLANTPLPPAIDAVIFDVTGTLINMEESQVRVIEVTVNNYFQKTAVSQKDIGRIRRVVGFNNEWDTTYALTRLIQDAVPSEDWETTAQKMLPIDRTTPLFKELYAIFQTCYLGSDLFKSLENGKAPFPYTPGLMAMEESFVSKELIAALKRKGYKLGIATGCPPAEALLSLKNLGLIGPDYFDEQYLVGLGDAPKEKPAPDPLLEVKRRLDAQHPLYIGDGFSDVEAARAAGMPCLYVGGQDPSATYSLIDQVLKAFL